MYEEILNFLVQNCKLPNEDIEHFKKIIDKITIQSYIKRKYINHNRKIDSYSSFYDELIG